MKKLPLSCAYLAFLSSLVLSPPSFAAKDSTARVTEAHGDVFKRGFVDWEKEVWDDPQPAKKGDVMREGMQLGTGEKSWAQLTWSYITARAWANSVYAIAPNQRLVYLMGGEMLYHLDKHRKDKSDYFVWTKLIQARIRGTTVLFQCTGDTTRVTVLEGSIDVMNRKDKSIIHIEPGVVYEVKDLQKETVIEGPTAANPASNNNVTINKSSDGSMLSGHLTAAAQKSAPIVALTAITSSNLESVKVFQTQQTLTTLYQADAKSLLAHPLLSTLEEPLSSLPLVTKSLRSLLPIVDSLLGDATGLLGKTFLSEAKILSVPKTVNYDVGAAVGKAFTLPAQTVSFFPPVGIIGKPGEPLGALANPEIVQGLNRAGLSGFMPTATGLNGLTGIAGATTVSGVAGAVGTSGVAGVSGVAGSIGAIGASGMSGVSGLTTGFSQVNGGALGAGRVPVGLSGVGASTGAGVAGLTGVVGAGSVSSLTNGTVSGVTGGVNTLLQNATGGINHLLNGTGGGILGLPLGK